MHSSKFKLKNNQQQYVATLSENKNVYLVIITISESTIMQISTRFFIIIILTISLLTSSTIMTSASSHQHISGFMYTRTRGRCTPQYWSSSRGKDTWPKIIPQKSTLSNVFGTQAFEQRYKQDLTIIDAVSASSTKNDVVLLKNNNEENAFRRLVKEATAALLNSYARKGYPYAPWEIKTLVIQALVSEEAADFQATKFLEANENCG